MAVYTNVTASEVASFLKDENLGDYVRHNGITQGVENSNFNLTTTKGQYILTIVEKRTDPAALPFIFSYMNHLAAKKIAVPDELVQGTLVGKPAVIIQFLPGAEIFEDGTTPDHCAQVGVTLARMHKAAEDFTGQRANPVGPDQWRQMFDAVEARLDKIVAATIAGQLTECACADWKTLPRGAIHADLFRDNVFFDAQGALSGVIDFYFACTSAYAYDLAITINAWCFGPDNAIMPARLKAMSDAYQAVRPLDQKEIEMLPALRRAAALRILMTRLYDWYFTPQDAKVVKKDPMEYFAKMTADFSWP